MKSPRVFFPGDPPLVEWVAALCAVVSLVLLASLLITFVIRRQIPSLVSAAIAFVLLVPAPALLVSRQVGPWKALKEKLAAFEAEAQMVQARCHGDRTCTIAHFDDKYGTTTFQFTPQHRPVRIFLRELDGLRPAVDFGGGATAIFERTWMFTVYSD